MIQNASEKFRDFRETDPRVELRGQEELGSAKLMRWICGLANPAYQSWYDKSPFRLANKNVAKKRERCGFRYHRLGHFSPLSVIFIFVGCWTIRRQSYALAKGVQYVIISVYYFNHYFCRPLIQNKLEVLGKAGLSEEELDADCTFFKVSNPVHVPPSLSLKRIHQNFRQLQQTQESKWTNHIMTQVRPLWRRVNQS